MVRTRVKADIRTVRMTLDTLHTLPSLLSFDFEWNVLISGVSVFLRLMDLSPMYAI